jgi:phosphoribosylaminoimidazole-succinocarboxamide synthase
VLGVRLHMHGALRSTSLNLPNRRQGKVRDIYDLPPDPRSGVARILIVATDRISAFDVVLPTPIPGKGRLLTDLSTFWLRFIERKGLSATHLISTDVADIPPEAFGAGCTPPEALEGRVTIACRAEVIPVECVARGYLEGSGWKEYQASGTVCGLRLPAGLRQCERLPEPIFTPATKAPQGAHDENISLERAREIVGAGVMEDLRRRTLAIYAAASEHARQRGIIIADTKFEFGLARDRTGADSVLLVDEALTPDSSRFWPADEYQPGRAQRSFDKQYLREWLEGLVAQGRWDKTSPGPTLPDWVVEATLARYREARDRLVA